MSRFRALVPQEGATVKMRRAGGFTLVEPPAMSRREANGFTLVELLVVVSIIALLVSILTPSMRMARYLTMEATCRGNMHEVGNAMPMYMSAFGTSEPWRFNGDSVDAAHESSHSRAPGNPARALMPNPSNGQGQHFLEDGRVFFCPLAPINYEDDFEWSPPYDYVHFWGSYVWHYKKVRFVDDPKANPDGSKTDGTPYHSRIYYSNRISENVCMIDTRAATWESYGFSAVPSEHYNALMADGSVDMVSRDWNYMLWWLWGDKKRPYPE